MALFKDLNSLLGAFNYFPEFEVEFLRAEKARIVNFEKNISKVFVKNYIKCLLRIVIYESQSFRYFDSEKITIF